MPTTPTYPFDSTGTASTNLVTNETQNIQSFNYLNAYLIIPAASPFYSNNLQIQYSDGINPSRILQEGIDYSLVFLYWAATRSIGIPVYGGILLNGSMLTGTVTYQYQTIGGAWVADASYILTQLANQIYNPRTTIWDTLTNVQQIFPPVNHGLAIDNTYGLDTLNNEITALASSIASRQTPTYNIAPQIIENGSFANTVGVLGDTLVFDTYQNGFNSPAIQASTISGTIDILYAESSTPAGIGTLSYNQAGSIIQWSPGNLSFGAAVSVLVDGIYYVPGPSANQGIWIAWQPSSPTGNYQTGYMTIIIPAQGNQSFGWKTTGFPTWYMALTRQSKIWANCPAFSNQNSLYREALFSMKSATTQSVLNAAQQWSLTNPSEWHISLGRNDIVHSIAYTTIIANLLAIYTKARSNGAQLFLYSITPSSTDTTAQRQLRSAVNRWMSHYAQSVSKTVFVNTDNLLTDIVTGNLAANCDSGDGLHLSATAAFLIGQQVASQSSNYASSDPYITAYSDVYDPTNNPYGNLIPVDGYAVHTGTSGTISAGMSGSVSTGWTAQVSGGASVSGSLKIRTDGRLGILQEYDTTYTSSGSITSQLTTPITIGYSPGTAYEAMAEINLYGVSGVIDVCTLQLTLAGTAESGPSCFIGSLPDPIAQGIPSVYDLVLKTPWFYMPAGITSINPTLLVSSSVVNSAAYVQEGQVAVRPVFF